MDRGADSGSASAESGGLASVKNPPLALCWWYGGKSHMLHKILPFFPPHNVYVEACGGGAALLLNKRPARLEIFNDVDGGLVGLFRVMADPDLSKELARRAAVTPYSRELYDQCVAECLADNYMAADPIERAWSFYLVARQSWSGKFAGGWSHGITAKSEGRLRGWLNAIDRLPEIAERLLRVQIEHMDVLRLLPKYDAKDVLFYVDPPYVHATRRGEAYQCEMTLEHHALLVEVLSSVVGMVVLSGYQHKVYVPLETSGWRRYDFEWKCSAAGERGTGAAKTRLKEMRTESLWLNPQTQEALENAEDLLSVYS